MRTMVFCCLLAACTTDPTTDSGDSAAEVAVNATAWVGRSYLLDMSEGSWPTPELEQLQRDLFLDVQLYVHLLDATETELTWLGFTGPMGEVQQSPCQPTFAFSPTPSTSTFSAAAATSPTRIDLDPGAFIVEDLRMEGRFSDDGTALTAVALSGTLDTRELAARFGQTDPNYACEALSSTGQSCVPCADGNTSCVDLGRTGILGEQTVSVAVAVQNEPYDPCVDHADECPDQCGT